VRSFSSAPPDKARPWEPCIVESKSVSRILCPDFRFEISELRSQIWNRDSDHSSSPFVAERIKRPTRRLRASSPVNAFLFGLAPRGVCLAAHVATRAGALLLPGFQI